MQNTRVDMCMRDTAEARVGFSAIRRADCLTSSGTSMWTRAIADAGTSAFRRQRGSQLDGRLVQAQALVAGVPWADRIRGLLDGAVRIYGLILLQVPAPAAGELRVARIRVPTAGATKEGMLRASAGVLENLCLGIGFKNTRVSTDPCGRPRMALS